MKEGYMPVDKKEKEIFANRAKEYLLMMYKERYGEDFNSILGN
jgi:hypothetical protein